jgi:hypothetical protein
VSIRSASLLSVAVLQATGCTSRYVIPTPELSHLDGYDVHREQRVEHSIVTDRAFRVVSSDGTPTDFNSRVLLRLDGAPGTAASFHAYDSVLVSDETFTGVPKGSPTPVVVNLGAVEHAEVEREDSGKSVALGLAIILAIPLGVAAAIVAARH